MATSSDLRRWWAAYKCEPSKMVRHPFPGVDRVWNLLVAEPTVPAWSEFTEIMLDYGYLFRESAGGTYNCRNVGGTDVPSNHSYGISVDLNPSKNSFGQDDNDYPPDFITAIENIKINSKQAIRWGGHFPTPDPMHWDINISPVDFVEDDGEDMTPEQEKAVNTLVALLNSDAADTPPWGSNFWIEYRNLWGTEAKSQPGPIAPVTHIQLGKIWHILDRAIKAVADGETDVDAVVAEIIERLDE